jgi:hypothetical protein
MEVKDIVKKLECSKEFKEWKKDNSSSYLVHVFKMFDKPNENVWQIGYYDKEKDTITTFTIEEGIVTINPESEIFKKEETKVSKLDLSKVRKDLEEVLAIANRFQNEKYSQDKPMKIIVILQNLSIGQVYNVTFVTQTFNTLNMKIDVADGKILKQQLISLMDFRAQ